jgi:hypothetical protein
MLVALIALTASVLAVALVAALERPRRLAPVVIRRRPSPPR